MVAIDPVCEMTVDGRVQARPFIRGKTYYFYSIYCKI